MAFTQREEKIIKNEMSKLKEEIKLTVFTDFTFSADKTNKNRKCLSCNTVMNILEQLSSAAEGKLIIEELSTEENKEMANQLKIERLPTIIFENSKKKELIRYTAIPDGNELVPFIKTLQYFSGVSPFYKDQIRSNLKNIDKSNIKLFITQTCPYCPQVLPITTLFALVGKGKIKVEIIDINANPDVAMKYNVSGVPHAIINEKENMYGMFTPQDLLDKLTKGQRDFGGMYA